MLFALHPHITVYRKGNGRPSCDNYPYKKEGAQMSTPSYWFDCFTIEFFLQQLIDSAAAAAVFIFFSAAAWAWIVPAELYASDLCSVTC